MPDQRGELGLAGEAERVTDLGDQRGGSDRERFVTQRGPVLVEISFDLMFAVDSAVDARTDVSIGAIASTLGILILSGILDAIPQLAAIHPWLFTHNWLSFADVMRTHISWTAIRKNLGLQAAYIAVFASAAWARFTPSDVLA